MDLFTGIGIPLSILLLVVGSTLLYFGAEGLVKGSISVAFRAGVTPLVIGLTVVAFGTSSPELVVSFTAGLEGNSEIAIGNVIGSNICNIALILGVAGLINPVKVDLKLIRTDIMIMISISVLIIILLLDLTVYRWEGIILFSGFLIYTFFTFYLAKKEKDPAIEKEYTEGIDKKGRKTWIDILLIIAGIIGLVIGANIFLDGAINIALALGATDAFVGLTLVAFGTSLPELATSAVAAIKKEGDISIGNAIGSNIFNILLIIGLTSIFIPLTAVNITWIDLGMMLGISLVIFPLTRIGLSLTRINGLFLLTLYVAYMYYLYSQLPN